MNGFFGKPSISGGSNLRVEILNYDTEGSVTLAPLLSCSFTSLIEVLNRNAYVSSILQWLSLDH